MGAIAVVGQVVLLCTVTAAVTGRRAPIRCIGMGAHSFLFYYFQATGATSEKLFY